VVVNTETEKTETTEPRKARCAYYRGCKSEVEVEKDREYKLAFFKEKPDEETDEYYCGCYGWD
jgi:hypothetical protein